jgi:hypothetical protein
VAWGANTNAYGLTNVPSGLGGVTSIAAGWLHNLAVTTNGAIVVWGDSFYNQTNLPASLPFAKSVGGGATHSVMLNTNNTVSAWGANYFGQTNIPIGLTNVTLLVAGGYHNLAIGTLILPPLFFNTLGTNLQMTANGFRMQVENALGTSPVILYVSTNLLVWQPIQTNAPLQGIVGFVDAPATNLQLRFYRAEQK